MGEDKKRDEILNEILDRELKMFLDVKSLEPSSCQEHPMAFRKMRYITHCVLSTDTLASYLEDLRKAEQQGRNLFTEKYARMDDLIPPLNSNPLIQKIVEIEFEWMKQLAERYPRLFQKPRDFTYLACELETYSDRTLELYYRDVCKAQEEGRNLAEERYTVLFKDLGYSSLEEKNASV